jgi:hypothetical protein
MYARLAIAATLLRYGILGTPPPIIGVNVPNLEYGIFDVRKIVSKSGGFILPATSRHQTPQSFSVIMTQ